MKKIIIVGSFCFAAFFYSLIGVINACANDYTKYISWGYAQIDWTIDYFFIRKDAPSDSLQIKIAEVYNVGFYGIKYKDHFVDISIIGPENTNVPPGHTNSLFQIIKVSGKIFDPNDNYSFYKLTLNDVGLIESGTGLQIAAHKKNDTADAISLGSSIIFFPNPEKEGPSELSPSFSYYKSGLMDGVLPPPIEDIVKCLDDEVNGCKFHFENNDGDYEEGPNTFIGIDLHIFPHAHIDIPPMPTGFHGTAIEMLLLKGSTSDVITPDSAESKH